MPEEFRPKKRRAFSRFYENSRARHRKRLSSLVAGAGPQSVWREKGNRKTRSEKIVQLGHLDKICSPIITPAPTFRAPESARAFGIAPLEAWRRRSGRGRTRAEFCLTRRATTSGSSTDGENFAVGNPEIIEIAADKRKGQKRSGNGARQHARKIDRQLLATYDRCMKIFKDAKSFLPKMR